MGPKNRRRVLMLWGVRMFSVRGEDYCLRPPGNCHDEDDICENSHMDMK
jgi:hypothetical protein